ncbi:MAG: TetR/AcrR family transcriptional regulator [Blastocatellia bacterium]|nr:TetR/AcrR family transcriptional regulator [Blastocatellia bacterium]
MSTQPILETQPESLSGSPLPKQERSRRTREKIIEAAIELFEQRGFEKTTSNDIAAAAGVSIGSFYVYFTDKRQVLLLVVERLMSQRIDAIFSNFHMEEKLSFTNLRQSIHNAVKRAFLNKCLTPGISRVILEMSGKDEEFAALRRKHFQRSIDALRHILELASQAGVTSEVNLDVATTIINHTVDALAAEYVLTENKTEAEQEALIEGLTEMIVRYVFNPDLRDCCQP